MSKGHPIVAEGQRPDGAWEKDPPSGYKPMRFSIDGKSLTLGDRIELLIEELWVPATFGGMSNCSLYIDVSFELGHHTEDIEQAMVPIDARFRIPRLVETDAHVEGLQAALAEGLAQADRG